MVISSSWFGWVCLVVFWTGSAFGAPWTPENAAWNVNFNPDGSDPSQYYGKWDGHTYHPSASDWRNVAVYQFITDRFRDGDPTNNESEHGGYNLYDVSARHGGDFKGIKEKLPYIKALGFDAIWISPMFQNGVNSYHGYAQEDFTLIDKRFGTLEDFRELVNEAHRQGMYVFVDIVVNHMANLLKFKDHEHGAPFRLHHGEYQLEWRDPDRRYVDFPIDNTFYPHGQYPDIFDYSGNRRADPGHGSYWFSDFHHNGDLGDYGDPWQNQLGKIYGSMDDLRLTHPRVQDKIIAMTKALIASTDVDGIRMDTPMQVPLEMFKRWAPAVRDHARSLGKDDFFIFGEFFCNREASATMIGRGKSPAHYGNPFAHIDGRKAMNSGINYDFYFSFIGPAIKYQRGGVDQAFKNYVADRNAYDFYEPARGEERYTMLNFYNNHDQWRLNWEQDGYQKSMLASAVVAFWPGMPLFYFGDEQGFASQGTALDGWSREDMMTSKAWYEVPSKAAGENPANGDNFNMTHPHYLHITKLLNIRRTYPALRETDRIYERWVQPNASNGIIAYTRVWGDQKEWALIAFNSWKDTLKAGGDRGDFYTGWNEGDRIVNVLRPEERYTLGKDGKLHELWMGGYEAKVFVREDNYRPLQPFVEFISPAHDAVVPPGPQPLEIRFSEPMDRGQIEGQIRHQGNPIGSFDISQDGRTFKTMVDAQEGINHIEVGGNARSCAGLLVKAAFQSRFRAGNPLNPIANAQKDYIHDPGLIEGIDTVGETLQIRLRHLATGAGKMRYSLNEGATWSGWENYSPQSSIALNPSERPAHIWVQYHADGSGAYFSYAAL